MAEVKIVMLAVVLLFGGLFVGFVVNFEITSHLITVSQDHWCSALDLLTKQKIPYPANPSKNPSRIEAWKLYQTFLHLKEQFGCH